MIATHNPLLELTARDLMSAPLVLLPKRMSMRNAAKRLLDEHVHGAPVVDEEGHCVGMLSTTDFLGWSKRIRPLLGERDDADRFFTAWQIIDPAEIPEDTVGEHMTHDTVSVSPEDNICQLAQRMIDAHIHRLVIVEEHQKPVGIISCTDVLAAVARARRG